MVRELRSFIGALRMHIPCISLLSGGRRIYQLMSFPTFSNQIDSIMKAYQKLQPPMACHALVTAFDLQMRPQHGDWMQRTDGRDDRVGECSFKIPMDPDLK